MEPTIPRGALVRVGPLAAPAPGVVAVLRRPGGHLLHRIVAVVPDTPGPLVLHRGDAGGHVGVARIEDVVGVGVAILDPCLELPPFDRLPAPIQRGFRRARRRSLLYAALRRLAQRIGWTSGQAPRLARRVSAALLT